MKYYLVFATLVSLVYGSSPSVQHLPECPALLQAREHQPNNSLSWNNLADFLIATVHNEIAKQGKALVLIPDINQEFHTKVKFVSVSGRFIADHGWFKNLSSLQRTGNVMVATNGSVHTLTCALGLGSVNLGFDHYQLKVSPLKVNGKISGSVGKNSIEITVVADFSRGVCRAALKDVKVVKLDDLKLVIEGFGVFNSVVSNVANSEIAKNKHVIIKNIEQNLSQEVTKALEKYHCNNTIN